MINITRIIDGYTDYFNGTNNLHFRLFDTIDCRKCKCELRCQNKCIEENNGAIITFMPNCVLKEVFDERLKLQVDRKFYNYHLIIQIIFFRI